MADFQSLLDDIRVLIQMELKDNYPKGITDSWDDSNPLALKLLDLLELYRNL